MHVRTAYESDAERFQRWHQSRGKRRYTPDFNTALENRIQDPTRQPKERVFDWVRRHSWGHHNDVAVEYGTNRPLTQANCAKDLQLDTSTVSRAVAALKREGRLAYSRFLEPVIEPAEANTERILVANGRNELRLFEAQWKRDHPEEAAELTSAEAMIAEGQARRKPIMLRMLDDWKREKKSKQSLESKDLPGVRTQSTSEDGANEGLSSGETDSGTVLYEDCTTKRLSVGTLTSDAGNGNVHTDTEERLHSAEEVMNAIPIEVFRRCKDTPRSALLLSIRRRLRDTPLELFTERILKRLGSIDSLGMLVNLAEDVAAFYRKNKQVIEMAAASTAASEAEAQKHTGESNRLAEAEEHARETAQHALAHMTDDERIQRRREKLTHPVHGPRLLSLSEPQRTEEIDLLILKDLIINARVPAAVTP